MGANDATTTTVPTPTTTKPTETTHTDPSKPAETKDRSPTSHYTTTPAVQAGSETATAPDKVADRSMYTAAQTPAPTTLEPATIWSAPSVAYPNHPKQRQHLASDGRVADEDYERA